MAPKEVRLIFNKSVAVENLVLKKAIKSLKAVLDAAKSMNSSQNGKSNFQ